MGSYPVRPTFPIDVRPGPGVITGRVGASLQIGVDIGTIAQNLKPSRNQFFTALETAYPGASATVMAAVPSDPSDPVNRAFTGSLLVAGTGPLAQFVKTTLGLTDNQLATILDAARLITE
ncbi:hypothetical protein [Methylobacterium brachythecii]|uniref:Uncharacterized protein n=1 Tax=Methylobacterium brachythecii TaxID=1176177 RepID=A0A7W6F934_9HYPH|nr:hypothetical protein [Methylobacterium brachythecii]MBB3905137.1 hypothetical protein [Methylobacterium brachythecii]GLS44356.1 hypothetical protein GCM10007884_23440 [Methylobacterium brachythecii]